MTDKNGLLVQNGDLWFKMDLKCKASKSVGLRYRRNRLYTASWEPL